MIIIIIKKKIKKNNNNNYVNFTNIDYDINFTQATTQ